MRHRGSRKSCGSAGGDVHCATNRYCAVGESRGSASLSVRCRLRTTGGVTGGAAQPDMRPPVNDNVACTLCAIDCHHSDQRETFKSWAIFKFLSTNCTSHQHKLWKLPSAPRSSSSRSRRRCVRAATPPRCLTHTAQAHKPEIHFNFFFDQCFFTIGAKNVYVTRTHTRLLCNCHSFLVYFYLNPARGTPFFGMISF